MAKRGGLALVDIPTIGIRFILLEIFRLIANDCVSNSNPMIIVDRHY